VCDDEPSRESLRSVAREAGVASETAENTAAACDSARSGQFQVVISSPSLSDGSWKRVKDIANRYNLGFEVIVLGRNLGRSECAKAINDGAFEVLKRPDQLPRAAQVVKTALWAAYLKGAGPRP
jgi:DNA-binding NtrC family response regulator